MKPQPKIKHKRKPKASSVDKYLLQIWRKAVLFLNGNRCAYCGADANHNEVECHHIIGRRNLVTKYNPLNGIPGCKYTCHRFYHTKTGERFIREHIGEECYSHLCELERYTLKDYLIKEGLTRKEWNEREKQTLMKVIKQ